MNPLNFNEYSDDSKKELMKVVNEIREQWLVNGRTNQFWFYPSMMSDKKLTEQVTIKWLSALSRKGILYFFRPHQDYATITSIALAKRNKDGKRTWKMDGGHEWGDNLYFELLFNASPGSYPGIAIDILDCDLDKLGQAISSKNLWSKFSVDEMGRYYYDGIELIGVNKSNNCKKLLSELLLSDDHSIAAEEASSLLSDDGTGEKRNAIKCELTKALRDVSHEIDIKTYKCGHRADRYELTIHKQ